MFLNVINSLSELEIPGHVMILQILISIFTRDGILMEKQVRNAVHLPNLNLNNGFLLLQHKIDLARAHYLHYTKTANHESSWLNATLHRVLKTVKDFAEQIRCQVVVSVKHWEILKVWNLKFNLNYENIYIYVFWLPFFVVFLSTPLKWGTDSLASSASQNDKTLLHTYLTLFNTWYLSKMVLGHN